MHTFETILYEVEGHVATVTINRPKALNALNEKVLNELMQVVAALKDDSRSVRVLILTGAGDKAFVAGADIAAMVEMNSEQALHFTQKGHHLGEALCALPQPVIAAVNGFALGGGCELALCADLVYASSKARFGQPEVNIGVMPGFGGTQRLPRRVGPLRAAEMIFTGEQVGAEEALRIGLCNAVFPAEELMLRVREVAQKIAGRAPLALWSSKQAIQGSFELPLSRGNHTEQRFFADLFSSEDQKEGMRAFLAKRPPSFTGR